MTPTFITNTGVDNFTNDWRPAVSPDGTTVIFESSIPNTPGTVLMQTSILPAGSTTLFIPSNVLSGYLQTRADWKWSNNTVVLNVQKPGEKPFVYFYDLPGENGYPYNGSSGCYYPTWMVDGDTLVVTSGNVDRYLSSTTGLFNTSIIGILVNDGRRMFGGMPAVNKINPWLAFAGQPDGGANQTDWYPSVTGYKEDYNYIFICRNSGEPEPVSQPMEENATTSNFSPSFQGRAPAWSPDGNWIAFETNRPAGGNYIIALYNVASQTFYPVTDPTSNAYHPKFSPDGKTLVFNAQQVRNGVVDSFCSIATIDVSGILQSAT